MLSAGTRCRAQSLPLLLISRKTTLISPFRIVCFQLSQQQQQQQQAKTSNSACSPKLRPASVDAKEPHVNHHRSHNNNNNSSTNNNNTSNSTGGGSSTGNNNNSGSTAKATNNVDHRKDGKAPAVGNSNNSNSSNSNNSSEGVKPTMETHGPPPPPGPPAGSLASSAQMAFSYMYQYGLPFDPSHPAYRSMASMLGAGTFFLSLFFQVLPSPTEFCFV